MPDPVHPAIAARIIADFHNLKARMVRAAQHLKDAMAIEPVSEVHAEAVATLIEHKQNELATLNAQATEAQAAVAALPPHTAAPTAPTAPTAPAPAPASAPIA